MNGPAIIEFLGFPLFYIYINTLINSQLAIIVTKEHRTAATIPPTVGFELAMSHRSTVEYHPPQNYFR